MIIGTVSYDPEKVLYSEVKLDRGKWVLSIAQSVSDTGAIDLEVEYDEYDEAVEALGDVDLSVTEARARAKKNNPVGFVSVEGVAVSPDTDDDDEVAKIGFQIK